jgi:hypothetical protein
MKLKRFAGLLVVALGLAVPAGANASGEIPASQMILEPKSGSFYNNAFKAAEWRVETGVTAPNPPNVEILPTRNTRLNLPPASQFTFNPPASMPVCPDNQIGPETNNSAPIPDIVAKCPNSIIGNGTATFLLNRVNQPENPSVSLNGVVVIFNGGRVGGQARLKFWAYSYDTGVAIYTEGTISPAGELDIPIPQLTFDSAVNSLNVNIPGQREEIYVPLLDQTVVLPGGQAPNYVQAKCDTGAFPYSADFLLGRRLTDGTPTGDQVNFDGIGEDVPCTGVRATAKLAKPAIKGPGTAKRGKVAKYKVTIRNTGGLAASGVRLKASGKGVKVNTAVGSIPAGGKKTVTLKVKFRSKGRIKATFLATSGNGGKQKATKTIRVR